MGISQCELELRLSLGLTSSCGSTETPPPSTEVEVDSGFERSSSYKPRENQKQVTMFYDGQICVCDVTEIQARAIISMAKREMDDAAAKLNPLPAPMEAVTAAPPPPPRVLNSGLSMNKSLQRFLQKRKMRLNAASPYTQKKPLCLFPVRFSGQILDR